MHDVQCPGTYRYVYIYVSIICIYIYTHVCIYVYASQQQPLSQAGRSELSGRNVCALNILGSF